MKYAEEIAEEITNALKCDSFHFDKGTKFEMNRNVDELDFNEKNGIILFDTIDSSKVKWNYTLTNYREANVPFSMFIAYKTDPDKNTSELFDDYIKKARKAADEFVLRLIKHDNINSRVRLKPSIIDVYSLFDLNISGVLLEVEAVVKNNDSSCLT